MEPFPKTLFGFYARHAMRGFYPTVLAWAAFSTIVKLSEDILWPIFQKWFVALFEGPVPDGMTFVEYATPPIIIMLSTWLLGDGLEIWRSILANRWVPKIRVQASVILNDYVHQQSMMFWSARLTGKVDSQIGYIVNGFWAIVHNSLQILISGIVIVVTSGLVLTMNRHIAMILIATFVARLIYSLALLRPMNRTAKNAADMQSSVHGKQIDSISNNSIVKLFAGRTSEIEYLAPPRKELVDAKIRAAFFQRLFWGVPMFVMDAAFGAMMFLCAVFYARGEMLVSEIVFSIAATIAIQRSISNIVNQIPEFVDVLGSALKSYEELIQPIAILDAPDAAELAVTKGAIEIRNVSFRYKNKKKVLDNFSLKIRAGEKVGLVGQSGAGKTTLVNLLMRLYDPSDGAIFIDGRDIRAVTQESLRRNIAFIPQEPSMFNRRLLDNIGYGKANATMAQIRAAAKHAEIDGFIMGLDKKYDSMVGDRGIKLSAGQKQRVAIARAFLKDAPILILDEATSALDSGTEVSIQKSFAELSRDKTTLVIAHRLSTLRHMDRIVVMSGGRIKEQGTHTELLKKKGGLYAKLWNMQSGGFISE